MARNNRRNRSRSEEQEELDSTTEIIMEQLDIDSLLNNEEAMAALRTRLLSEMAQAHPEEATAVQPPPERRHRAFDSDDYDFDALETGNETESIDEIAQQAAYKLAVDSSDIAEHIIADHQRDSMMMGLPAAQQDSRLGGAWPFTGSSSKSSSREQQQQQGKQQKGGNASSKAGASGQQQQQQQVKAAAASQSGEGQGSSREKQGGSSSSSGSSSAPGGARGGGTGVARLSGDTAIGRVAESKPGTAVVVLKKGKARLFESGSPMVYSGAVDCVIGRPPPAAGDAVVVADANLVPLAWGVYNPVSMFRVRIMQLEAEALADDSAVLDIPALLDLRVSQAVGLRAALGLPSTATNVARLVNSEGDRLSGVVADMMGDTIVVQSCAAWSERYRQSVTVTLLRHAPCSRVVWRPAAGILKEEGIDVAAAELAAAAAAAESSSSSTEEYSPMSSLKSVDADATAENEQQQQQQSRHVSPNGSSSSSSSGSGSWLANAVRVQEAGISFLATPEAGQKTGFYADQRQNRAFIASMAAGKTVLDLCCYSGGFGLMAAAAGAAAVTGVDSSGSAVELATANAELNGLSDRCAFVRDDVSTFLRAALEAGEAFDIVILDPPKLAPNKSSLPRASIKYKRLNVLALGVVRSGGILMTCSCSGAMTQSGGLSKIVAEAAMEAERQVTLLAKSGAAPDHPLHPAYPEGEYLTALTYRVL